MKFQTTYNVKKYTKIKFNQSNEFILFNEFKYSVDFCHVFIRKSLE